MANTVKERLLAFINHKGLSKNKFETLCGLSKRYVSNISRSISPVVAERISLTFPDLNMGWLLAGEGEMLLQPEGERDVHIKESLTLSGDALKLFINMSETLSRQEENISKLADMVDRLTGGQASTPKNGTA